VADDRYSDIPVIDISALVNRTEQRYEVASRLQRACRTHGFFYIVGHGVDLGLQQRLERMSRLFFSRDLRTKLEIGMARGGRAWRGYFAVGDELTSGKPDLKEGLYFGAELGEEHPLVQAGTPMHGPNLFPSSIPLFRQTVLDYLDAMAQLGHSLMAGIALSLDLEESYFEDRYTREPLILFRIFNYPPLNSELEQESPLSVGEHTDYGLLTILRQDSSGGLQIKRESQWMAAPPIPDSFVCNIGDMLERMTGGYYVSTPHRVRNSSGRDRLSFAFFFDPNFNAEVESIRLAAEVNDNKDERWDHTSVHEFRGTYGDYLLGKVSRVFPQLKREVL
jgi:isopenicillin N synthase-like dioxygenase